MVDSVFIVKSAIIKRENSRDFDLFEIITDLPFTTSARFLSLPYIWSTLEYWFIEKSGCGEGAWVLRRQVGQQRRLSIISGISGTRTKVAVKQDNGDGLVRGGSWGGKVNSNSLRAFEEAT